jgi:hypothetical protein
MTSIWIAKLPLSGSAGGNDYSLSNMRQAERETLHGVAEEYARKLENRWHFEKGDHGGFLCKQCDNSGLAPKSSFAVAL